MMAKLSPAIQKFMQDFGVQSDEVWEVHGTTWVVKHKALERVAAERGIVWNMPQVIEHDAANQIAVICVAGKLGERSEWSIGEASPKNNRNAYPYAMAEKRAKDRVILKLLNTHGTLYSEAEADEFRETGNSNGIKRDNPHVTQARDVNEFELRADENGEQIDAIPVWKHRDVHKIKVADARPVAETLLLAMRQSKTAQDITRFAEANAREFAKLPDKWIDMYQGEYQTLLDELRANRKAA